MVQQGKKRTNPWLTALFSVFLSLIGLSIAIFTFGDVKELKQLSVIAPWALPVALLVLLLMFFAAGLRLSVLMQLSGERLTLLQGVRAYILGLFSAAVTPSGSGHAPAMALSIMQTGVKSSKAWSVSLYTSILDLLFFAWMLPLTALWLFWDAAPILSMHFWGIILVALFFIGIWYVLTFQLDKAQKIVQVIFIHSWLRRWYRPATRFTRNLTSNMNLLSGQTLAKHIYLQFLSVLMHLSNYAILYIMLCGLGARPAFFDTLALTFLVSLVAFVIPTPGASGYMEIAMPLFVNSQLEAAFALPAVLGWRVIVHYSSFLLGPILGGGVLTHFLNQDDEALVET